MLSPYLPQSYYYPGYPYGDHCKEQAVALFVRHVACTPTNPKQVQALKIFEGRRKPRLNTNGSSSSRYFSGIAISATANTLHVVMAATTISGAPFLWQLRKPAAGDRVVIQI